MQPWHAWLLAALLLAAQALGLAHRVEHAPGSQPLHAAAHALVHGAGEHSASESGRSGHQPGDADCRLVDQLGHADALCSAPVLAAAILPPAGQGVAPASRLAAMPPPAAYQARAPPQA